MYLTQWKPWAEPMKTFFHRGWKGAWFMAWALDGVQYSGCGCRSDSPSPLRPARDMPHSSPLSHCFIYSRLTCSWGTTPPFWAVEISNIGLYNTKCWNGLSFCSFGSISSCKVFMRCFMDRRWVGGNDVRCSYCILCNPLQKPTTNIMYFTDAFGSVTYST